LGIAATEATSEFEAVAGFCERCNGAIASSLLVRGLLHVCVFVEFYCAITTEFFDAQRASTRA